MTNFYLVHAAWSSGLGRWIWNLEVPGSNPPPSHYLDLFSVVPSSTPRPRCVNSQLVSLPPVGILNSFYYSFKIFSRFWLVKTTRIIHHNQLLFTKFGKNLRHIELMTSKVELSENYWTIDVKMTSKVQPAADYWTVDRENLGTRLCHIWWAEKQRAKWRNSFKNE